MVTSAPKVLVPVPLDVKLLNVIAPEFNVVVAFPEKTTVEVPAVNVPVPFVNNGPVVPDNVIVEALAVNAAGDAPIVSVVPERA